MRLMGLMPNVGHHLRGVLSGREAAVGLRNQWTLGEGIRLHTGFEQIRSLNGLDRTSMALTGAVEYTANPDWKGSARLEYRTDASSNQLLGTLGLAYKLSNDWTLLGRNAFQIQESKAVTGGSKTQERLQLGMAYRDSVELRWDALGRYEFKHEGDTTSAVITQRSAHFLSTHASYQPRADLSFTGRYAGKHVLENSSGINSSYSAHLLSARADYDIARDWTIGVNAGVLFSAGLRSRQGALGAELGRVLTKTADKATALPGDTINYTVSYQNNSSTPIGTIVISDATPAFTTFVSAACNLPLPTAITQCTFVTSPALGGGTSIQWTLTGALNPASVGQVVFAVKVNN